MKYFLQVTLTTYIATMLVYALWSYITFLTPNQGWIGSLAYLPHGCRVIFYCFFGIRSIPALYLAEITGPSLVWPGQYLPYWNIASLSSVLSVVVAVESLKWSRVSTFSYSILKKVNFANYKFLIYVTIISASLNAIFTNLLLSLMNDVSIDVVVISRFFIGDMIGTACFVIFLMMMFGMLKNKRLLPVNDD